MKNGYKKSFKVTLLLSIVCTSVSLLSIAFCTYKLDNLYGFNSRLAITSSNNIISSPHVESSQSIQLKQDLAHVKKLIIPNQSNLIIEIESKYRDNIIKGIGGLGGKINNIYKFHNQLAVFIPLINLGGLKEVVGINKIWKDRVFSARMNVSVPIIKPPSAWSAVESYFNYSINGSGIKVAVLDTGVDANHYDLYPRVILNNSYVPTEGSNDENGHGTHVAGIIAGNGNRSSGKYVGVAPASLILNFKVLNKFAVGYESAVLQAMEDAVGNNSDIINLSLATEESGSGNDPYSQKVEWVVNQGIPVIVAAGGNGDQYYNISCPGVCEKAITVGSTDDFDNIYNSPYGPTLTPSFSMKPDVLAPGWRIISVRASLAGGFGLPVDVFYTQVSGTSMATAHVTGAVALLKQVYATWSPEMLKNALMNTAEDLGLNPFKQGCGRINIPRAINLSLLMSGSLSFKLVGVGDNIAKNLTIQNLDNSWNNISFTHTNLDYSIISQYNVSPLSSVEIPVSLKPVSFTSHQNYDRISINYSSDKQAHSIMVAVIPTTSLNMPARYANTSVFGNYIIDDVINYNYTNYYSKLYINESLYDTNLLNATGWFNFSSYLFEKNYYNISTRLYDPDDNFLYSCGQIYYVGGLDTSFTINLAPLVIGFASAGNVVFNDSTVTGIVEIWLVTEYRSGSVQCEVKNGRGDFLIFWGILSGNNPIEVWPVKANYLGSSKHNPVTASGSLNVFPQLRPKPFEVPYWVWLVVVGMSVFLGIFLFDYYRRGKRIREFSDEIDADDKRKDVMRKAKAQVTKLETARDLGEAPKNDANKDIQDIPPENKSVKPSEESISALELKMNNATSGNRPNVIILRQIIQDINSIDYQKLAIKEKTKLNILKYRIYINLSNYKAAQNVAFVLVGNYAEQGNYKERDVWKVRAEGLDKRAKLHRQIASSKKRRNK